MKKNRILLVLLAMLLLIPVGAFAKKGKSASRAKYMFQGGLNIGLNLPSLTMMNTGVPGELILTESEMKEYPWAFNSFVQFGAELGADFGLYYVTKHNRAVGFMINVGYSFSGGVHAYSGYRTVNPLDPKGYTFSEVIGEKDKTALFSHSIYADLNFAGKAKMNGNANFAFELGVRFLPTFEYGLPFDDNWKPLDEEYHSKHWNFYCGPNFFLGADIRTSDHCMLTPGFRFSATFGADPEQTWDERRDYRTVCVKSNLNFAFELKINGYVKK